ncbi:hypothetical protein BDV26DRAFT_280235 [Aspergillus bertholletiae]|uniref:BRCT domain-containing protein n=1 Tax=Aspergillus bertholletiae TaxID=1226010 RepID=A0A5N7BCK2_9EURO|nr:hypothetical protein BDV26DRAFT_280235 [Aspergillus bertholletiae]
MPTTNQKPTPTPQNHLTLDCWNSCATGHQRADSSTGTAWRRTREEKLARQFCSTSDDCTDSRSKGNRGEWVWSNWGQEIRNPGQRDIRSMMCVGKRSRDDDDDDGGSGLRKDGGSFERKIKVSKVVGSEINTTKTTATNTSTTGSLMDRLSSSLPETKPVPQVFRGVTIHINSACHLGVSDHYLKRLLTMHGAVISLSLSRKVSHIIVAKPNAGPGMGTGGGLAAAKLQREILRGGWKGVKVVFVEWALESIEAGKRLSEAKFAMDIRPKGQKSVLFFTGI